MPREIIETGKTVDAVIEEACRKLGCDREQCDFEIIDLPKKGFLGLRNTPAKVRVWAREETMKSEPVLEKLDKKLSAPVAVPAALQKQAAPNPQVMKSGPEQTRPRRTESERPPAREIRKETPVEFPKKQERSRRESSSIINPKKIELAVEYLSGVLKELGLTAAISTQQEDGGVCINIEGKGLGAIIGRRGETLDAIQYLTSLVANRIDGDYMRITIDCGDYRLKRKETLEALARKLAAQVLRTNAAKTLEPMNPFERRIIHATVSEIEGVSSISVGEEPNRKVVITSPAAKARYGRNDRNDRREGGRGGYPRTPSREGERPRTNEKDFHGGSGERKPDSVPTPPKFPKNETAKKTPESTVSADKLYTKIDLE